LCVIKRCGRIIEEYRLDLLPTELSETDSTLLLKVKDRVQSLETDHLSEQGILRIEVNNFPCLVLG
jgi:hypothetical protein